MVGKWLAFAPDNEFGGFYMGMAACESSGPNKNMPIVFMRGPGDEEQVSLITLSHGLRKPPTRPCIIYSASHSASHNTLH